MRKKALVGVSILLVLSVLLLIIRLTDSSSYALPDNITNGENYDQEQDTLCRGFPQLQVRCNAYLLLQT